MYICKNKPVKYNIMSIIKESIEGSIIKVDINSSNIVHASYNTELKELTMIFKNGSIYLYNNVPWEVFVQLRQSESQGKFFIKEIKDKYPYKKIK